MIASIPGDFRRALTDNHLNFSDRAVICRSFAQAEWGEKFNLPAPLYGRRVPRQRDADWLGIYKETDQGLRSAPVHWVIVGGEPTFANHFPVMVVPSRPV